jgi:archaellum component FlaC
MYDQPSKIPAKYEEPQPQKAAPQTTTERQRDILTRNGIAEDFDADIEAFNNLEDAIVFVDDDVVSASDAMKPIDDEIENIENVLRCALG